MDIRRCCDVESTSLTLIQRRSNVVCPLLDVRFEAGSVFAMSDPSIWIHQQDVATCVWRRLCHAALQGQKTVSAHFSSKQILPISFARQYTSVKVCTPLHYLTGKGRSTVSGGSRHRVQEALQKLLQIMRASVFDTQEHVIPLLKWNSPSHSRYVWRVGMDLYTIERWMTWWVSDTLSQAMSRIHNNTYK